MFTGIISGLGRIESVEPLGASPSHGVRLHLSTPAGYLADVALGESIAIQGACMTVTALQAQADRFTVEVSAESLARTAGLNAAGAVNLEKALRAADRLGGHIVSGHVDGIGRVAAFSPVGESWQLLIAAPTALAPFLAYKGSITVNGVSLTVNQISDTPSQCEVRINLIAHTLAHTTLGALQVGQSVNLEIDLIARYVARMLGQGWAAATPQPAP